MAKITSIDLLHESLTLTLEERKVVQDHATMEGLTFSESLEDFFEYAILQTTGLPSDKSSELAKPQQWELASAALKVSYPEHGPLAALNGEEKGFIGGMLLECFDLALHSVLVSRSLQEKVDVMERAGKGMGTGESPISIV